MSVKTGLLVSPNTVLANALNRTLDFLRPKIAQLHPKAVEFLVGTQINGTPHLGTHLVQTCAFLLAQKTRRAFAVDTRVLFTALDNAPYEVILDPETHHSYQISYFHQLGEAEITKLVDKHYRRFFEALADQTDVDYEIMSYTSQQASSIFRSQFLQILKYGEEMRWFLSPSHGGLPLRLPCPKCNWAEKRAERTKLLDLSETQAIFKSFCFDHGEYELVVASDSEAYLDLNTIFRNVVKEAMFSFDGTTLSVVIKGGDWALGCQLVDWALSILPLDRKLWPIRLFAPQITTETGSKLSKSLIRKNEMSFPDINCEWVIDPSKWNGSFDDYVLALVWLVEQLLSDPKHFFRSYSYQELQRLMVNRPITSSDTPRKRAISIYRKYYDMIADGTKTIEVRVGYSSMKRIKPGTLLEFQCQRDACLTRVIAVREYKSFDEMMSVEDHVKINPHAGKEEQLKEIRKIFQPEKEKLGVLAIEIENCNSDEKRY